MVMLSLFISGACSTSTGTRLHAETSRWGETYLAPRRASERDILPWPDLEQTGTAQAHNGFPLPGTQIWKILSDLVIGDLKICAKTVWMKEWFFHLMDFIQCQGLGHRLPSSTCALQPYCLNKDLSHDDPLTFFNKYMLSRTIKK